MFFCRYISRYAVFIVLYLGMSAGVAASETWRVASLDWEPYSGASLPAQGDAVRVLRDVLDGEGIELEVTFSHWKRAQIMAREDPGVVGYFPAWPEEVYEGFVASPPIAMSQVGVLRHDEVELTFDSVEELFRKYTVGVVASYTYPREITEAMRQYPEHVLKAVDERALLRQLAGQRHSAAITDPNVMMFLAEREQLDNVVLERVLMQRELVLALRDDARAPARLQLLRRLLTDSP